MNLEFIGVNGAILNSHFENCEELIASFSGLNQSELEILCTPEYDEGEYHYAVIDLGFTNHVIAKIEGVYEEGVAFRFTCYVDNAGAKYDSATSGLLILKNNIKPVFIIDMLDVRANVKSLGEYKPNTYFICVNTDKVNHLLSNLGERIDMDNFIGKRKQKNIFNKKNLENKIELTQTKIKLIVYNFFKQLSNSYRTDNYRKK